MTQRWLYMGILLIFAGLILNEVTLWLVNLQDPIIPGVQPHSRPVILGTGFLFLIPIGLIFIILHFLLRSKMASGIVSPFQE